MSDVADSQTTGMSDVAESQISVSNRDRLPFIQPSAATARPNCRHSMRRAAFLKLAFHSGTRPRLAEDPHLGLFRQAAFGRRGIDSCRSILENRPGSYSCKPVLLAFSSCETAVTICPMAKGLAIRMLLGTPLDVHS